MGVILDTRPTTTGARGSDVTADDGGAPLFIASSPHTDAVPPGAKNGFGNKTADAPPCQKSTSSLEILDRFIDEPRPLKVAVIGGGLAGILAGVLLPAKVPGIELIIYEKNQNFVRPTRNLAYDVLYTY